MVRMKILFVKKSGFGTISGSTVSISELLIHNYYDGDGTGNSTNAIYTGKLDKSVVNILDGFNMGPDNITTELTFDNNYGRVENKNTTSSGIGYNHSYDYTYDMADNLLTSEHTVNSILASPTLTTNTFDLQGRLKTTKVKVDNIEKEILSDVSYFNDDLIEQKIIRQNNEHINYSYNDNRWLTNINIPQTNFLILDDCVIPPSPAPLLDFNIYYNDSNPDISAPPRKNGNISSLQWTKYVIWFYI